MQMDQSDHVKMLHGCRKIYVRPQARGPELLLVSRIAVGAFGLIAGGLCCMLYAVCTHLLSCMTFACLHACSPAGTYCCVLQPTSLVCIPYAYGLQAGC